ncbi:MAG TPA: VWA domain-containing protein [Pyrinomonadaceae bacterium]|nr:VWA domain-containing protein [Pyrinomonadaceae bacterium]
MKIKPSLALLLSFCILLPALAQTQPGAPPPQPPQQQQPVDDKDDVVRITTNLVQVDAVVTKDGKVVTNLTADDFELYQDGKKQTITSFTYISNVPNVPGTAAPPKPRDKNAEVPPAPHPVNPNEPRRTIALVVDDLGMSAQSIGLARKQLKKFINEQLQPNDLVAIIRTGGELGVLQQFTNDKRVLSRAIERLRWNHCSRVGLDVFRSVGSILDGGILGSPCGGGSLSTTGRSLRFILDGMARLPGRKSLVLFSDDLAREEQDASFDYERLRGQSLEGESSGNRALDGFGNTTDFSGMLQRLAEKAIRASVVIYSVDTQGLMPIGPTAADSFNGRNITDQINRLLASRSELLWRRREGGELIARQTGGFQIRNSNSFKLDQILEDQSGYYLLGYRPGEETFNRKFHHIKAKVKRSGMTLRTRFGFFGVSEEEANKNRFTAVDAANLALASPFRAQDINVDITTFFANDQTTGSVARSFVYIEAKDMTFKPVNDRHQTSFELHGVIFGDNGSIVSQVIRGAKVSLSQSDYEYALRNGIALTFDIPVKSTGALQVRIAARDKASSRIGSAGQFVDVPDLSKKKLAVSGVILGTASDATGQELANPGARRFAPNADVYFVYMIFNATNESGALRNLVMQVKLFRDDTNVYTGPEVPVKTAANQKDPSRVVASGSVRLPPELEPGSYYLQVAVTETGGKNKPVRVVQWVDFEIQK